MISQEKSGTVHVKKQLMVVFLMNVFAGAKPHPNAVLNLLVQQPVTSALPIVYYMAARRGLDLLMDTLLPSSAVLSSQMLRFAICGLIALREMELMDTH